MQMRTVPFLWLLPLPAFLLAAGCSDTNRIVAAPNNAPQIVITSPIQEEGDAPVEVQEELGLQVIVQVDDGEDRNDLLTIHWGALRTDVDDVEVDLGLIHPDSTGWAAMQVVGLSGGNWYLWARVEDTDGATDEVGLNLLVFPANTPPLAAEAVLGPEPAYETTQLICEGVGWHDIDGDEPNWMARWYVDDVEVAGQIGLTLDGDSFRKDEQVMCELTPFDGQLVGDPVLSNVVTILNSAPEAPTVSIDPEPTAEVDEVITCEVDDLATDVDGDIIVWTGDYLVQWYVDSVLVPDLEDLWEVPAERTSLGEQWTCEIMATDGSDWSAPATASTAILPEDGDLVITEVMASPGQVADVAGEWIELYNASGRATSLLGFELYGDDGDSHVIQVDVEVGPGERLVLGRNADFATNGAITTDYEYSGFSLDNVSDVVGLRFEGVLIDRVEYDLSSYADAIVGRSLGLDPSLGIPSAVLNDDAGNWCLAGDPVAGLQGDFASPGSANSQCDCFASDDDGDGWGDHSSCVEQDCDDAQPLAFPGNAEVCDGIDNDCVAGIDDLFDEDGDNVTTCGPDGVPGNSDDDCDDDAATGGNTFPGNPEVCDGIDNDCIGGADDGYDQDGDGVLTCGPDLSPGTADDDCDDNPTTGANTFPGNPEVCDGIDNDCVGGADDGFDLDGDGVTTCGPDGQPGNGDDDCNDVAGSGGNTFPGNPEVCDGIDNDCVGGVDDGFDLDGDGVTTCGPDGQPGNGDDDCNDVPGSGGNTFPGNPEVCDGIDNDCLGGVDNGFDGDGDGVTLCGPDGVYGNGDDDCDDGNPVRSPNLSEVCDGIDNDCDFVADEDFDQDGDGVTTCGPDNNFATTYDNDCNDTPGIGASSYPGNIEQCDGIDNNCVGGTDEAGAAGCQGYYTDADNDGYGIGSSQCLCSSSGVIRAIQAGDCFDSNGSARPGQTLWFAFHRGDNNWDYNCDSQQTKRWTQTSGSCAFFSDLCNVSDGWQANSAPGCGVGANWGIGCHYSTDPWYNPTAWGCYFNSSVSRTQQCR